MYILFLQDPREYFDSQHANALKALGDSGGMKSINCNMSTEEVYLYLRRQISEVKTRGLEIPVIQPEAALKVNFYFAVGYTC